MGELIVGVLAGLVLTAGWPPSAQALAAVLCGIATYLGSCAWWPYVPCPWCAGESRRRDAPAGEAYRRRAACRVCGGGDYRRLGARVLGRG